MGGRGFSSDFAWELTVFLQTLPDKRELAAAVLSPITPPRFWYFGHHSEALLALVLLNLALRDKILRNTLPEKIYTFSLTLLRQS